MMIEFDEYKVKLNGLKPKLDELAASLGIERCKEDIERLHAQIESPGFWDNAEVSQKVMKQARQVEAKVERYEKMCSHWEDLMTICEMAIEENDDSMLEELKEGYTALEEEMERERLETLLSGGDGLRFSPVFTSQPSAFPLFGNKITQKPFTSSSAACCVDSGSFTDAHQTPPCSARVYKTSSRASSAICASGRSTCSAMSLPDVSPSRNNTVSSCPPQRTFRVSKSAASSNCAVSARPSTIAFHLVGIIVPPSGKNYTAAFAYAA